MNTENIFEGIPAKLPDELLSELFNTDTAAAGRLRIERIVSQGHRSPEGFWCDQETAEWVIVLEGSAGILFQRDAEPVELKPGSYVNIPAHEKHRVAWTDPRRRTVWLAIHYRG